MLFHKYSGIRADIVKVVILSCVIITIFFVAISRYLNEDYRDTHIKQIEFFLKQLVLSNREELANELFSGQKMSLLSALKKIEESKNIFTVEIFTPDGQLKAYTGDLLPKNFNDFVGAVGSEADFRVVKVGNVEAAIYTTDISFANEVFGFIRIHYRLEELFRYIFNVQLLFGAMILLVFFLVIIVLNYYLSQMIVKPVLNLRKVMVGFSADNWGDQCEIIRENEIGDMYLAFNAMSLRLRKNCNELEQSSKDLISEMNRRKTAEEAILNHEKEIDIRQRTKVAGELHDGVGQSLQAAKLCLKILGEKIKNNKAIAKGDVDNILDEVNESITQLRLITTELKPIVLNWMALAEAISYHCEKLSGYSGITIETHICHGELFLEPQVKEHIFLIFQEALNNAIKHSNSHTIKISLSRINSSVLTLNVQDYGKGFNLDSEHSVSDGIGMCLMKERAVAIGGKLNFLSDWRGSAIELHFNLDS